MRLNIKQGQRISGLLDSDLAEFYQARLPSHIHNRHALETWLQKGHSETLKLNRSEWLERFYVDDTAQFPDSINVNGKAIRVIL